MSLKKNKDLMVCLSRKEPGCWTFCTRCALAPRLRHQTFEAHYLEQRSSSHNVSPIFCEVLGAVPAHGAYPDELPDKS